MANIDIPVGTPVATANTAISAAVAGDVIRFEKGGTYIGQFEITDSGASGNVITVTSYGSGTTPIITTRDVLPGWNTGANWTDMGGNVWRKDLANNSQNTNYRIWLDGVEYNRSENAAGVNSTKRTSYNTNITYHLYVYATSNPATFYSLIEYSNTFQCALLLDASDYVTITGLDIRGGAGASIDIQIADHILIENCSVGWDGARIGIRKTGACDDVIIRDNVIDSGDRLEDDFAVFWGIEDGISAAGTGTTNWYIYRNTVKDWGHSCINIDIHTGTGSNIEIYENFLSAENVDYCRGIGFDGIVGSNPTSSFKIYRNLIYKTKTQIQINCPNLLFYNNIINGVMNSLNPQVATGVGKGLDLAGYSGRSPTNMKIYNNVIANCESEGLHIQNSVGREEATGNEFTNNIFYNNGDLTPDDYDDAQIVIVENSADLHANTFRNNILYKAGVTDRIFYDNRNAGNEFMTIAEFNARNGIDSDVITGNISVDPLFADPDSDFSLQSESPALEAGIDLGADFDDALLPASTWPDGVLTGLQSAPWNIGSFITGVVQKILHIKAGKILVHAGKILTRNIKNIESISTIDPVSVPYRTAFGTNGATVGLPSTVTANLVGGGSTNIAVTWAIGSYNPGGTTGSTIALYTDAEYEIIGTPVESDVIKNPSLVTITADVIVKTPWFPLTTGIEVLWDTTQLVTNSTNTYGTVNGSNGITSVLSLAPGPLGRDLVSIGTAPILSGNRAVFNGTGAFEEASVTTNFDFMHYNATAANMKWTAIMGVNPTDTGTVYGIMGDNGNSAALDGFCIFVSTDTTKTGIATKITGNGANIFLAYNDNFLTLGSEQIITSQVDNALANGSGRCKHLTNLTSTNNTVAGTGTLDSASAGKLMLGDVGGVSSAEMTGTLSIVVILSGVEPDAIRNKLIEDLAAYTGVTI